MTKQVSPQLVAHRGYPDRYPENTLTGIQAALDAGARYVEFDVQMTPDRQFAVIHDDTLFRTAGIEGSVFEHKLEQLQSISVHEPARFGQSYDKTFIPSLHAMLQLVKQYAGATALVEVKQESIDHWGLHKVMDILLHQLRSYQDICIVISFNDKAIEYTQRNAELRTGWVLPQYYVEHRDRAMRLQPDFLICNQEKVRDEIKLWPGDWQWMLYGIEQQQLVDLWRKRGVSYMETDCIGTLIKT